MATALCLLKERKDQIGVVATDIWHNIILTEQLEAHLKAGTFGPEFINAFEREYAIQLALYRLR